MLCRLMASLVAPLLVAVVSATATTAPRGAQLLQVARSPYGTYGMPPCKHCGAARLHSRDDLLAMEDGDLLKMKDTFTKDVEDLEGDVSDIKKKQGDELGKLQKRLTDMDTAYKKFGKDTIDRTAKFTIAKAKASKDLSGKLDNTLQTHNEIAKLHTSMDDMRKFLNPYVDKFISGKGWPHGCKCAKAKSLLQSLEASLKLASIDIGAFETTEAAVAPARRAEALLRRSAKALKPADQEKYKLVREVQQLEEKRAKLNQEKTLAISGFGQKQRATLDRIDVANIKANLKASTEQKYKDSDSDLEANLKSQADAADSYLDTAKAQLARLKKNDEASLKLFKSFKDELQKCKCL